MATHTYQFNVSRNTIETCVVEVDAVSIDHAHDKVFNGSGSVDDPERGIRQIEEWEPEKSEIYLTDADWLENRSQSSSQT